jgi:hypothetical protein
MQETQILIPLTNNAQAVTPLNAITEPVEKSKPPEAKAMVIPTAIIPSEENPTAVDIRLSLVKKYGENILKIALITIIMSNTVASLNEEIDFQILFSFKL